MGKVFLVVASVCFIFVAFGLCARDEVLRAAAAEILQVRHEILRLKALRRYLMPQADLQRRAIERIDDGIQRRCFLLELCGDPRAYGLLPFNEG